MHLNIIQLAESLGVEEAVVEGWIRNDGLPHFRDGGRLLFDRAQVVSWAAERGLAARAGFLAPEPPGGSVNLEALMRAGGIWRDARPADLAPLFVSILQRIPVLSADMLRVLSQRLRAPGGITWAPVGKGIALPHLRNRVALGRESGLIAVILLKEPLILEEPPTDGVPITRLLFFTAPTPRAHLQMLGELSRALSGGRLGKALETGAPDEALFQSVRQPSSSTRPPPEPGPLQAEGGRS